MKRKRNPLGKIIEWKARLCAGGHRSVKGLNCWDTCSPVMSWSNAHLLIVLALIIMNWHMRSVDFVLAFPQAPVKTDICMRPPKVPENFSFPDSPQPTDKFTEVHKLVKNSCGLKDAGTTWHEHLKMGLLKRGWIQSEIDSCLFAQNGILRIVHVDGAILFSPSVTKILHKIKSLQSTFDLTDDSMSKDCLGARFHCNPSGTSITLTQPKMIQRVLELVSLHDKDSVKLHDTLACNTKLLDNDPNSSPQSQSWNCCLSHLNTMVRPDITMATQQCAHFCNNPSKEHEEAVKRICCHLSKTHDRGLVLRPDRSKGLECCVDADWAGSWQQRSGHEPISCHSRTGFVLMFAGCPIMWSSEIQPLIALSATEAEHIALSSALCKVISLVHLLSELQQRHFILPITTPNIVCKVFEDNKSCIKIAANHETRPRTKHLSVRLHHFRSCVTTKQISIVHVSTKQQVADIFTKPLPRQQFQHLSHQLMGWRPNLKSASAA